MWVCVSIIPGMTVSPVQSITSLSAGIVTDPDLPHLQDPLTLHDDNAVGDGRLTGIGDELLCSL